MSKRVKTGHEKGVVYPNVWSDFEWARENLAELYAKYGTCVALIYEKQVIGIGQTIEDAEQNAEKELAAEISEVTPITYFINKPENRYRLYRVSEKEQ